MSDTYSLAIDCPPGNPRPPALLAFVLKNTGVVLDPDATSSRLFGCWTWTIPPEQHDAYAKVREVIGARLAQLHAAGTIRYAHY